MAITLRAARVNAGLSRNEVAEALGIHVVTLHKWENGVTEPKLTKLTQMCEMYGIDIKDVKILDS